MHPPVDEPPPLSHCEESIWMPFKQNYKIYLYNIFLFMKLTNLEYHWVENVINPLPISHVSTVYVFLLSFVTQLSFESHNNIYIVKENTISVQIYRVLLRMILVKKAWGFFPQFSVYSALMCMNVYMCMICVMCDVQNGQWEGPGEKKTKQQKLWFLQSFSSKKR